MPALARLSEREPTSTEGLVEAQEARTASSEHCADTQRASFVITITRLRPQAGTLSASVGMCASASVLERLRATTGDREPVAEQTSRGFILKRRWRKSAIRVRIAGVIPSGGAALRVPLADLVGAARSVAPGVSRATPGTIELPLLGQPDSYPFDWFSLQSSIDITVPPGMEFTEKESGGVSRTAFLPFRIVARTDPEVGDFDVEATPDSSDAEILDVYVDRELSTKVFVCVVLLVPLVFAILLAITAGAARASSENAATAARNLLLGFVGVSLSLLPIRQVLVPSEIEGLTLVDWWLGGTLIVFATIATWSTARALRPPRAERSSGTSEDPSKSGGDASAEQSRRG